VHQERCGKKGALPSHHAGENREGTQSRIGYVGKGLSLFGISNQRCPKTTSCRIRKKKLKAQGGPVRERITPEKGCSLRTGKEDALGGFYRVGNRG